MNSSMENFERKKIESLKMIAIQLRRIAEILQKIDERLLNLSVTTSSEAADDLK